MDLTPIHRNKPNTLPLQHKAINMSNYLRNALPLRYLAFLLITGLFTRCAVIKDLTTDRPKPEAGTVTAPEPERSPVPGFDREARLRREIINYAETLKGITYQAAGKKPETGFDCSGFTSYVMAANGLKLSASARDQAIQGKEVPLDDVRPGDLIFYKRKPQDPIFHVSLVIENTRDVLWVIHSTTSRGVIVENVLASSYWKPYIYMARDVIRSN